MAERRDDKITLGVTPAGTAALEEIMGTGWFEEEMDAFRVAISLAFAHNLLKEPSEMTGVSTKWNVGTIDPDGLLRTMVVLLSDGNGERPYAHAEARAAAGLEYLKVHLIDQNKQLFEVLTEASDSHID